METGTAATAAFRPAGPADLEAIHVLRREFYAEDDSPWGEGPARAALEALLSEPERGRVWIATDGATAVGFVVLTFGYSLEFHGRDAFVDELYIRPTHRRRGLGAAALRILEEACRDRDVHALHLEVLAANEPACALYRRWGFSEHGRQLMTKWL